MKTEQIYKIFKSFENVLFCPKCVKHKQKYENLPTISLYSFLVLKCHNFHYFKPERGKELTALDSLIDGIRMDIKSVTEEGPSYLNQITKKEIQLTKWNKQENDNANSVCLYFHDKSLFSLDKLVETKRRIMSVKNKRTEFAVKFIYCVIRGYDDLIKSGY